MVKGSEEMGISPALGAALAESAFIIRLNAAVSSSVGLFIEDVM